MEIGQSRISVQGHKKGQFFAYDAIIAGALFSVLLAMLFIYWSAIHSLIFSQVDDMYRVGISMTDTILTPGSPADWNVGNVHQFGLTDEFGTLKLDSTKVSRMYTYSILDANYSTMKEKMGSGRYEFLITVDGYPNDIGRAPVEPTGMITITRPVIYESQPSNLTVVIWMNYTI